MEWLQSLGHEAVHLHELGFDRWADTDILGKAREEGWIVLTSDLDFGDLLAASRDALPSVVIFRLKDMRPDNVNAHLISLFHQHSEDLTQGVIVSVTKRKLRVRRLPIE